MNPDIMYNYNVVIKICFYVTIVFIFLCFVIGSEFFSDTQKKLNCISTDKLLYI